MIFILCKQNQDSWYLSALGIILTKYSRWIGKACCFFLLVMVFHPVLYDFYLMLQNPQAYCIYFLTRKAYLLTVLFFLKLQAILVVGKPVALEVSLCLMLADISVPRRGIGLWCGNNWLLFHDVHRLFIQIKSRD